MAGLPVTVPWGTSFIRAATAGRMVSRGVRIRTIVGSVIRCDDPMPEGEPG